MDRKDKANNILLSRDFALALKPKRFDLKHDRNRNVCVLGGPGSGKTRYYVKPNLMQANADFLVTDPKGTLLGDVGWMLEDAGYDIRTFDTMLALPQNQPNAPLYPAGGAPGSRPGALPHFGRPRYLGPPPRARSTAG